MKRPVALLVLAASTVLAANHSAAQAPPSPPPLIAYDPATKHHYQVISVPGGLTWTAAVEAAKQHQHLGTKGHLVVITTAAEQQFLTSNLFVQDAWMGAYQSRQARDYKEPLGGWSWVTGEPWGYVAWNDGEPNNSGPNEDVATFWGNGRWNDFDYQAKVERYVVEYPTTGPSPTQPPVSTSQQIEQLLARSARDYKAIKSYSATIEFSFKAHIDTVAAIRAQITIEPPSRFRLEARGSSGRVVAVSNGRTVAMATTEPGEKMKYLVKPFRGLGVAVEEAMSLLIDAPRPPSLVGFILGSTQPRLWSAAGRIGELTDADPKEQAIRSDITLQLLGEDPIDGQAALKFSADELRVQSSELSFRYMAFPFTVREVHKDIKINAPVPPETFTFVPTQGAMEVDDLGEEAEEITFGVPRRR